MSSERNSGAPIGAPMYMNAHIADMRVVEALYTLGIPWEQGNPPVTVWHRSRPAPATERVSHCTLAHSHLGSLASIKG